MIRQDLRFVNRTYNLYNYTSRARNKNSATRCRAFQCGGNVQKLKRTAGLRVVFQAVLVGGAAGVFAEGVGEVALR